MNTNQMPPKDKPEDEASPAPTEDEAGVDLTLIRWALTLEPIERLRHVERMNASIAKLRALNASGEEDAP